MAVEIGTGVPLAGIQDLFHTHRLPPPLCQPPHFQPEQSIGQWLPSPSSGSEKGRAMVPLALALPKPASAKGKCQMMRTVGQHGGFRPCSSPANHDGRLTAELANQALPLLHVAPSRSPGVRRSVRTWARADLASAGLGLNLSHSLRS